MRMGKVWNPRKLRCTLDDYDPLLKKAVEANPRQLDKVKEWTPMGRLERRMRARPLLRFASGSGKLHYGPNDSCGWGSHLPRICRPYDSWSALIYHIMNNKIKKMVLKLHRVLYFVIRHRLHAQSARAYQFRARIENIINKMKFTKPCRGSPNACAL